MQYSLLNHFRGTLLGAAAGEALGKYSQGKSRLELQLIWQGSCFAAPALEQPLEFTPMIHSCTETLIRLGDIRPKDLNSNLVEGKADARAAKVLAATLPVALFFHENEANLWQKVSQLSEQEGGTSEVRNGALAVAYAIAQSLQERLRPTELITYTLAYLRQPNTSLVQQLGQVQKLLEQQAGLDRAVSQLLSASSSRAEPISTSIALAFYCFLSTLEDLGLTIARAARAGYQSQMTAMLAGALSGAYNSRAGIPCLWQLHFNSTRAIQKPALQSFSEPRILQLADQLMATWCGNYQPTQIGMKTDDSSPEPAVTAPRVIRPS
jgi:ADP-ribosylglycohydrolase